MNKAASANLEFIHSEKDLEKFKNLQNYFGDSNSTANETTAPKEVSSIADSSIISSLPQ